MRAKPKLIAELAKEHKGSVETAAKLIEDAKTAGFDFVKLQAYNIEDINNGHPNKERYVQSHLTIKQLRELWHVANQNDIGFFCSCFSYSLLDQLREFTDIIKIPSTFFSHDTFVNKCIKTFDSVHMSTGMHTLNDIAIRFSSYIDKLYCDKKTCDVVLYHCVSEYPTPPEHAKMGRVGGYYFRGYSDHTRGTMAMIIAATRGAKYIEKHFSTLADKKEWCADIEEMKMFKEDLNDLHEYFRDDGMSEKEKSNYEFFKREYKDLSIL